MKKKEGFGKKDSILLLNDLCCPKCLKGRSKKILKTNEKLLSIVNKLKLSNDSFQAILSIFFQIRIIEFIYFIISEKDRKNFRINRNGFKTDAEFFEFIFTNQILEIEETKIRLKVMNLLEEFLAELKKVEKKERIS